MVWSSKYSSNPRKIIEGLPVFCVTLFDLQFAPQAATTSNTAAEYSLKFPSLD
jgi:hypothetical protein